jgi:delta(3,5)-delta(2,4)-dienoyl-CoA isomerase
MANAAADWNYEFFNVSFPAEYVAHVEINRQEKLNAFVEV